jgi:hypothetical protein
MMTFALPLSPEWSSQGWKAKIRDRERLEPPHVTILRKTLAWRLSLRDGAFLDAEPDPRQVPSALVREVRARFPLLRAAWDERYPDNPVNSEEPLAR